MAKQIIDRLERLDYLIRTKATGTPAELSRKLKISERGIYIYIDLLKRMGAPINYDRTRNCYYYEVEGRFYFSFVKDTNRFIQENEIHLEKR